MSHVSDIGGDEQIVAIEDDGEAGVAGNERSQHARHCARASCRVADRPSATGARPDPRSATLIPRVVGHLIDSITAVVSASRACPVAGPHPGGRWWPEAAELASGTVREVATGLEESLAPLRQ